MNRFIETVIKSAAKREGMNVKVKVNRRNNTDDL